MGKLAERMKRRYKTNAPAAADEWLKGCLETDKDPIALALKAYQDWVNAIQQAIKEGRLKTALELLSKSDWIKGVEGAGPTAYRTGVEGKVYKFEGFADGFEDVYLKASEEAKKLPKGVTIPEKLKRVEAAIKVLMENKGKWRGRRT